MHKLLIMAGALVAASAGFAAAQTEQHGRGAMLAAADANHDGNITRAEFDHARAARFAQMDANHDGSLQASERPQWGERQPANASSGARRGDPNGDGVISRAEYDVQAGRMFDRMDADHNGSISAAELQAMAARRAEHQSQ
jgi:hypothetical protein